MFIDTPANSLALFHRSEMCGLMNFGVTTFRSYGARGGLAVNSINIWLLWSLKQNQLVDISQLQFQEEQL